MPKGVYPHTHMRPKVYPAELVDRVRALYLSGLTQAEVGAQLGLSQKVIYSVMRRHDIPRRTAAKRDQWGANNVRWKDDEAGYQAFHLRVERRYGQPMECSTCGTTDPSKSYDWANLTGDYPNPDDYARMCRSCHRQYDNSRRGVIANAR